MKKIIDLHLHSTASDGSLSPAELVEAAARVGVSSLALTDHDTTAGLEEAAEAALRLGIDFIPGIELSCSTACRQVDVLGYYVPLGKPDFEKKLAGLRAARDRRNALILEKLARLGLPVSREALAEEAAGSSIGRPHMAAQLVKLGYVKSMKEAFERFLGDGKSAYVPKEDFSPSEAVALLVSVGAVPVIAHPVLIRASSEELEALVASLVPQGLAGLEAYHSEHDGRGVRSMVGLADKYGLITTGGSDFHGAAKPCIAIGKGRGSLVVPEFVLERLMALRPFI